MKLREYTTPCGACGRKVIFPYRCEHCSGLYCFEHRLHEKHRDMSYVIRPETKSVLRKGRELAKRAHSDKTSNKKEKSKKQQLHPSGLEVKRNEAVKLCPLCRYPLEKLRAKTRGGFSTTYRCPNRRTHKNLGYNRIVKNMIHSREELISVNNARSPLPKTRVGFGCPKCGHVYAYVCQQRRLKGDDSAVRVLRCAKRNFSFED